MCKYFDTDFANSDFSLLWGSPGRNDLDTIRTGLKMNFIALYDWSGGFCRNHTPFLNAAWNGGTNPLKVTIPISNFNVQTAFDPVTRSNILSILYQAYGLNANGGGTPKINPAVSMWRIGNEVQKNGIAPKNAAEVAKIIVNFEKDKRIPNNQQLVFTSDVDFGILNSQQPGIFQLLALKAAFINAGLSDIWYRRFIASINTTKPRPVHRQLRQKCLPASGRFQPGQRLAHVLYRIRLEQQRCVYLCQGQYESESQLQLARRPEQGSVRSMTRLNSRLARLWRKRRRPRAQAIFTVLRYSSGRMPSGSVPPTTPTGNGAPNPCSGSKPWARKPWMDRFPEGLAACSARPIR